MNTSRVLALFRAGKDTNDIARILSIPESEAYNRLARERDAAPDVTVPAWVPAHIHPEYLRIAKLHGEEYAASVARRMKREVAL